MPRLELRRWRWSSIAAGALTLGLTLGQKQAIARRARKGYGTEFGADGAFQHVVSRRYRDERASVETPAAQAGA